MKNKRIETRDNFCDRIRLNEMGLTYRKDKQKNMVFNKAKGKPLWCVDNWIKVIFIDKSICVGQGEYDRTLVRCCSNETKKETEVVIILNSTVLDNFFITSINTIGLVMMKSFFQEENASYHRAKSIKVFFFKKSIENQ